MFEIGSSLRQARRRQALSLADVERATCVRQKYLTALEEERFDVLPGAAYVRGFLRTYAEFLGLDGNLCVDEYNAHAIPLEDDLPAIQHAPLARPRRRAPQPLLTAAASLAAGVVIVWQLGFASAERAPLVAERLAGLSVPRQVAGTLAAVHRQRAGAAAAAPSPALLVVRAARGDCWVAVRVGSSNGAKLVERILPRGEAVRFSVRSRKLWVRLGAPSNADVSVRGKPVRGLPHGRPVNLQAA